MAFLPFLFLIYEVVSFTSEVCPFCAPMLSSPINVAITENTPHVLNDDDFAVFNGLRDVNSVVKEQSNHTLLAQHLDDVDEVGRVLMNYGLHSYVGIAVLHKHFDLLEGEKMVFANAADGQLDLDMFEFTVSNLTKDDHLLIGMPARISSSEEFICPYMFRFDTVSGWHPLQYFPCNEEQREMVFSLFSSDFEEALREVAAVLMRNGVEHKLGLTILFEHLFEDGVLESDDLVFTEDTYELERIQTFKKIPKNNDKIMVTTLYSFAFKSCDWTEAGNCEPMGCVTNAQGVHEHYHNSG